MIIIVHPAWTTVCSEFIPPDKDHDTKSPARHTALIKISPLFQYLHDTQHCNSELSVTIKQSLNQILRLGTWCVTMFI